MTTETQTRPWSAEILEKIQSILDQSAATASPEVGRVFARPDWRLSAEQFLTMWEQQRWCTIASVGPKGQPHIAVIHADFSREDGRLTMRMFENSVRAQDLKTNPRVALSKHTADGAVAMVYGRAAVIEGTRVERQGAATWLVEINVTRIYAMQPRRD
ncbi:MAG: pyridoxamine 5'-phosphate oxidase family protein [Dehalococcoidia bacterium]|nr:pyridoxamine 5'-phosphate oxidase family protein [Dehalococcoidia bacterium]